MITIINDDAVKWASEYDGELFHAMFCDAPYELGFMGKKWDNTGISFRVKTWEEFKKVLHPGAFGMTFGGSRTAHRMATAIEDAGFIIHPQLVWAYGSGFPKATRIDTQIDRAENAEREDIDLVFADGSRQRKTARHYSGSLRKSATAPATPMAKVWQEHRYGLQALKPAAEPIIVFQKPYEGKPVDCIVETGAGALWIDGARIEYTGDTDPRTFGGEWRTDKAAKNIYKGWFEGVPISISENGRWPANFILSHDYECQYDESGWTCVDSCSVKRMGEQSGGLRSRGNRNGTKSGKAFFGNAEPDFSENNFCKDSGTASRFFYNADWMYERLEDNDPFIYQAKASRIERESGLENFEEQRRNTMGNGLTGISGDRTGKTQNVKPIEAGINYVRNHHPTLKPISLAIHLASLLLPPEHYSPRRLFVPFAGVASECIGANIAGWESVTGIELEKEYCEIGTARAQYWTPARASKFFGKKNKISLPTNNESNNNNQLKMF